MKRPLKWKLFNLANIILFVIFSLVFLAAIILMIEGVKHTSDENFFYRLAFAFGIMLVLANYIFNFYVLRKYFPNKLFTKGLKITNLIFLCINTLIWFFLVFALYTGYNEEFVTNSSSSPEGKLIFFVLAFTLILKAYVLILQFSFQSVIAKNYRENMLDLIDSLGDEKPKSII